MKTKLPKTFEATMEQLENCVTALEQGEHSLSQSVELYKEGMRLAEHGEKLLKAAEAQVKMVTEDQELVDFTPEEDDSSDDA